MAQRKPYGESSGGGIEPSPQSRPRRRAPSPWRPLRPLGILLLALLLYGTVGYVVLLDWPVLDGIYMTLITITSVGFREVHPLDTVGKVFTITLLVFGVTVLLTAVAIGAGVITQRGFSERTRRRKMQRRLDVMRDHFIVCAYGRVGRATAQQLAEEEVTFVVVDRDSALEPQMQDDGVPYSIGDPTSEEVLKGVGIERAKAIICAVDSDADNVYTVLAARSLNEGIYIIARASSPESIDRLRRAGADRVVSPYVNSGRHMAVLASQPRITDYFEVEVGPHTTLRIDELYVDRDSELVGTRISDSLEGKTPLALRRAGGDLVTPPHPELRFEAGDLLLLLRETETPRA